MSMTRLLFLLAIMCSGFVPAFCQTTATDYTGNDCPGVNHHLFGELDAGKIIVISFVEPCGGCIGPTLSARSVFDGYGAAHGSRMLFYLADDFGNTPCSTLQSWASTNSIHADIFSDPGFAETDYGSIAMPKIVVLAGTDHRIIFKQDNSLTPSDMQAAIDAYLATTSVEQVPAENMALNLFPNPVYNDLIVSFTPNSSAVADIEIYNAVGSKVQTISVNETTGKNNIRISLDGSLGNGLYFLKLRAGTQCSTARFTIAR